MREFVTVAEMVEALRALPQDARLVMTHGGYYCYSELASVCLPEAYTMESDEAEVPEGTVVYRLGHSNQNP